MDENGKGVFLAADERKARLKTLTKLARAAAVKLRKGEADNDDVLALREFDREITRLQAIDRGATDVAFFAYQYFSDGHNAANGAGNIIRNEEDGTPHEILEELAPIHADFYDICDKVATAPNGGNYVIAAPRGHAKTQVFSVILALHELCYRKRHYVLVLSETDSLSKKIIASIASQLKYNEKLRQDFGELLSPIANKNVKDNEEAFITATNVLVEASSAGKSLRGKSHLSYRPDLVLADDLSSMNNEGTEAQRLKLIDWWNSVIMPLPAKNAAIVFVGTKVTATGLLAHLLDRRDFDKVFHRAIIDPPANPQLWQDYVHLYVKEDDFRVVDEFYETHRAELEEGIVLAWPNRWTYRELMHVKVNVGARSFASEYMNESFSEDEQLFRVEEYEYYRSVNSSGQATIVYKDRHIPVKSLRLTGAWDVAMAQSQRSALNAFVTIGKEDKTGLIFVIDVYASREYPSDFIRAIMERVDVYGHDKVIVEGIGAYADFGRQLQEQMRIAGLLSTRIETVRTHGKLSKAQRIEMLEPMFANQTLILNVQHTVLLDQLRNYIPGTHSLVDAIDALQMAVEGGAKRKAVIQDKPAWL